MEKMELARSSGPGQESAAGEVKYSWATLPHPKPGPSQQIPTGPEVKGHLKRTEARALKKMQAPLAESQERARTGDSPTAEASSSVSPRLPTAADAFSSSC